MKVTQVGIRPTPASDAAGRPALTPELLAASGARYSRNNEGLDSILSKIDPNNLDKSVDGIFRMIDYGHQSIADMAPVAIFIDDVSLWLAYNVWTLCPTAGGQESSTRYINYAAVQSLDAEAFGIPEDLRDEWQNAMRESFAMYERVLALWENIATQNPEVTRIPRSLLEDGSEKAQKQVARMKRNYAFDRARYYLPVAAPTNMMMVMSARGWVNLCQHLLSHPLPEPQQLGALIRDELALAAPRLLKHAAEKDSMRGGLRAELHSWQQLAKQWSDEYLRETQGTQGTPENPPTAFLETFASCGENNFADDLSFHDNRYAWVGEGLKRTALRFGWDAVAMAELRDLNRHRTGTKYCPLVPRGFSAAQDQWPQDNASALSAGCALGRNLSSRAKALLSKGDASFIYWTLLGTQYFFEHTTTADKFVYEAELRTGTGAHYRYAQHLHDTLQLWFEKFPETRGLVLEGSAEPE
jgi:thymidylate synthase ThyX